MKTMKQILNEQQIEEIRVRRQIFESCTFDEIIDNKFLRAAMGW
jgi:hypothetical protein